MNKRIKRTVYCLLVVWMGIMHSCTGEEGSPCRVDIRLLPPAGYSALPSGEMTVTLTNKSHGVSYASQSSAEGLASFSVECGYYTVSVHYQSASGVIFSGRIESLPLLSPSDGGATVVELRLSRSQTHALVIKEVYYGGCMGRLGEEYQADQYLTIYNNSTGTLYLDGLCIAVVDPASLLESPWMKYTDMKKIPVNDIAWQFPGSGRDYPLPPGGETTVAVNAVNHTGGEYGHVNSVDLSKVDWGFWDAGLKRQDIEAGVTPLKLISNLNPNLIMYAFPVVGPTIIVFGMEGVKAEEYVADITNRAPRPQSANRTRQYLMIPWEWVVDCVECVESINQVTNKRVPDELNHTPVYMPQGLYGGKSVVRKKKIADDGRVVYQDTNNAAEDFEVSLPLLKK